MAAADATDAAVAAAVMAAADATDAAVAVAAAASASGLAALALGCGGVAAVAAAGAEATGAGATAIGTGAVGRKQGFGLLQPESIRFGLGEVPRSRLRQEVLFVTRRSCGVT